ncbi:hypothetical protein BDW02DRAFT_578128 [Decorospora gaudefroyi]|uniref:Uncharacterized protein n=1 Tax=Decorospora gaudefroyi TaxID=184978 RepID=A0A6A5KKH6_9PLEO|nr:hypothetical protein BDW02DRAFT_578128 [Decorospora gaudefroyi]
MARRPAAQKAPRKSPRLDSGFASDGNTEITTSGPATPASATYSAIRRKLSLPAFSNTKWDFGISKAFRQENKLQLRQPKGFPIIPLPQTLARARAEAEAEAEAEARAAFEKLHEPGFEIYEDPGNDGDVDTTTSVDNTAEELSSEINSPNHMPMVWTARRSVRIAKAVQPLYAQSDEESVVEGSKKRKGGRGCTWASKQKKVNQTKKAKKEKKAC